jgi:serine-type D-Ala-D-Ala carboxypeptidase/endopeptidase (penicillin-binding protein 4)
VSPRSRRTTGRHRFVLVAAIVVVLTLGVAAVAYQQGLLDSGLSPDTQAAAPAPPGFTLAPQPGPRPVARPAPVTDRTSGPTSAQVRRALGSAVRDPQLADVSVVVAPLDGASDAPLVRDGRGLVMPASTLKLLTTTAALEVLGPGHTFATRAVGGRRLTLVGGGDPFLTSRQSKGYASLQALARLTSRRLHSRGIGRVHLTYDASLFTGPTVSPSWPKGYLPYVVSPITALWADEGRNPDGPGFVADPPATAAATFASYLGKDGVRVLGTPQAGTAPSAAPELARVTSPPLGDIVEQVLQNSDNEGAEVLGHQVGLAVTGQASYAGGVRGVRTTLTRLGIDLQGARFYDGSGLSRLDRIDPRTLVEVLRLDARVDHPELRSVISGLPVAAFVGSLSQRFRGTEGRGWVRAKTGTLTGTSALAGLATTREGHTLVFALVSNNVPVLDTLDARVALDDLATRLATCRC